MAVLTNFKVDKSYKAVEIGPNRGRSGFIVTGYKKWKEETAKEQNQVKRGTNKQKHHKNMLL